nr:KorSAF protein [Frankia sp. ArI3]
MAELGYRQIADELRGKIVAGEYAPDTVLPTLVELMARYQASRETVRRAIGQLETEGLVQAIRRRGTVVRARPDRSKIVRPRGVFRDSLGYLMARDSGDWRELRPSVVEYRPARSLPAGMAELIGAQPDDDVLVRDRLLGDPEQAAQRQAGVSYLPSDITRGTVIEQLRTGPGGLYDRLEEICGELVWDEEISAEAAAPTDVEQLALHPGTPVLRIVRIVRARATDRVVEVCDTRISAELYAVRYRLARHRSAAYPPQPSAANPSDPGTPRSPGIGHTPPSREEAPDIGPNSPQK